MKQVIENKIRNILVNAQATQDEKIKMIADMCDSNIKDAINETMYFVRTHHSSSSYPNYEIHNIVVEKLSNVTK